jgi:hypothetical protein
VCEFGKRETSEGGRHKTPLAVMSASGRKFGQLFRFPDGTVKRVEVPGNLTIEEICKLPEVR